MPRRILVVASAVVAAVLLALAPPPRRRDRTRPRSPGQASRAVRITWNGPAFGRFLAAARIWSGSATRSAQR